MAQLSLNDTVQVPEAVLSRELDGETVLLNLETGVYFGLDAVATAMWNALRAGGSLRSAHGALTAEFDAPPAQIEADLLELAEAMLAKGLIRRKGSTA